MIHPDLAELVAYCDSEISEERRHQISAHLEECSSCRTEAERIKEDLLEFAKSDRGSYTVNIFPEGQRLDRLKGGMRVVSASHVSATAQEQPQAHVASDLVRELTDELASSLGPQATSQLVESIASAGPNEEELKRVILLELKTTCSAANAPELADRLLAIWKRHRKSNSAQPDKQ